jgi:hypothetical protein
MSKAEARDVIRRWVTRHEKRRLPILSIRHIHTRSVVVGYAAPSCLVVRQDFREGEKHMRDWEREHPLELVRCFDSRLREGDPCYVGYVSTPNIGEPVAVRAK